ncbi:MAG: hypothetical protein ACPHGX_00185, partial [Ilumatobacteraceae bacterium]
MGINGTLKGITATTMIGAGLLGIGGVAHAATESVVLHNDTAQVGFDCPDSSGDWWHFVITPNNGSHEFESITLNVAGSQHNFAGGAIVSNGAQRDNVFVAVPAGHMADDLRSGGSSAEITDAERRTKFERTNPEPRPQR